MFNPKARSMVSGADKLTAQAREASAMAAQNAAQRATQGAQAAAQTAAQTASAAAQTAAEMASKSVRKGVFSARGWAAPRLESAADYTTDTIAPKVSTMLRDAARQMSHSNGRKTSFRSRLRWSLLATAVAAAAGAAALLARQRYRAAMTADTDEDGSAVPGRSTPVAETEPTKPTGSAPADRPAETEVNGRVSATG